MECREKSSIAFLLIVLTIGIASIVLVDGEFTDIVQTTSGPVRGEKLFTVHSVQYAAFKGIRYAKPPVGQLRFKPPVPIDPWDDVVNATTEGEDCPQSDFSTDDIRGSEDCLFINVFTPVTDLQRAPVENSKSVMVWIYGGAFTTGTSSSLRYNPDYIIEKDVVYVTMNYRLGALGFLNLYHPNATGNAGLKDQVLALKWVQANIAKFGGNPKNVTIFGQSAGAASVGYQVLSDASAGLFHAAISMSGVPLNPWAFQTREKALLQAFKLGSYLGTTTIDKTRLLQTLNRASAHDIVNATSRIWKALPPFVPTLEDESISNDVFLSTCSMKKYKNGNYNRVPQMLGFTDHETLAFFGVANEIGLPLPPGLRLAKRLIDLGVNVLEYITTATLKMIINETTDLLFIAQIDQTQKFLVETVKPIYYYHVSFYSEKSVQHILMNSTLEGAGHSDDLEYIFYMPERNYSSDPNDPVVRTIHRYSTMWTNFAKYGNPTPNWIKDKDLVKWPISEASGYSCNIGKNLSIEKRPISVQASAIQIASRPHLGSLNGCGILSAIIY